MKVLLHICCAVCCIYPYQRLKQSGKSSVTGFFYNPNIHPFTEYKKRKDALSDYSAGAGFEVVFHKYDIENFFQRVSGAEKVPARCAACWRMRLEETAAFAGSNGFNAFTTTLLASPYQDQAKIREIGLDISKETGVDFLFEDFRSGFRASQKQARDTGLYRQKYCGCVFSERERWDD